MSRIANAEQAERRSLSKSGRILCLLFFALAWFQLSYAGHQFEHVAGDPGGNCAICTQMERLDAAVVPEPAGMPVAAALPVPAVEPIRLATPDPVRRYETRAPPVT